MRFPLVLLVAVLLGSPGAVFGQLSMFDKPSPQDPVPGLIARVYIGDKPTNLVAVFTTGTEFHDSIKAKATDLLRGAFKNPDAIEYRAIGFTNLAQDGELSFAVGNNNCLLNGRNLGNGTFTFKVPKGKRTLEVSRKDGGQGQGGCAITDPATKACAAFHTGEMLSRELDRSYRVDNKMLKSVLLNGPPEAAK